MTTRPTRTIRPHKGGRTARAPEARIRPQTLERIHETMREQGKTFADLLEDTYQGETEMDAENDVSVKFRDDYDATVTLTFRVTGTKKTLDVTSYNGRGLWIDGKQIEGKMQFKMKPKDRGALVRYFKNYPF